MKIGWTGIGLLVNYRAHFSAGKSLYICEYQRRCGATVILLKSVAVVYCFTLRKHTLMSPVG
jgi:hypothetical protein